MKEPILIEKLDDEKVCVYSKYSGAILDVCTLQVAGHRYDIVGEIFKGNTKIFNENEEEDESYSEFLDPDIEED